MMARILKSTLYSDFLLSMYQGTDFAECPIGFNTVRRCCSAREHLLCGLQDVLEHVLVPVGAAGQTLLAHVLGLDPASMTFSHFLFDLLSLLRGSQGDEILKGLLCSNCK
jgi:hypothetical protein